MMGDQEASTLLQYKDKEFPSQNRKIRAIEVVICDRNGAIEEHERVIALCSRVVGLCFHFLPTVLPPRLFGKCCFPPLQCSTYTVDYNQILYTQPRFCSVLS